MDKEEKIGPIVLIELALKIIKLGIEKTEIIANALSINIENSEGKNIIK